MTRSGPPLDEGPARARRRLGVHRVRRLALAVAAGLVLGIGAFAATGFESPTIYLGPCYPVVGEGFDPWTGLPHGSVWECAPWIVPAGAGATATEGRPGFAQPPSDAIAGRWAVPVPLGFVAGAGLALVAGARRDRRPC